MAYVRIRQRRSRREILAAGVSAHRVSGELSGVGAIAADLSNRVDDRRSRSSRYGRCRAGYVPSSSRRRDVGADGQRQLIQRLAKSARDGNKRRPRRRFRGLGAGCLARRRAAAAPVVPEFARPSVSIQSSRRSVPRARAVGRFSVRRAGVDGRCLRRLGVHRKDRARRRVRVVEARRGDLRRARGADARVDERLWNPARRRSRDSELSSARSTTTTTSTGAAPACP